VFTHVGGKLECVCGKCRDYLHVPPGAVPHNETYKITQRASYICNQNSDTDDFDINKYELSLIKEYIGQKINAASGDSQSIVFDKHVCIFAHYTLLTPWLPDLRISYSQADDTSSKQVEQIDEFDEGKDNQSDDGYTEAQHSSYINTGSTPPPEGVE
jgi:hypothetical protein